MIGNKKTNKLYSIKKISFKAKSKVILAFEASDEGNIDLMLYLICDSYIGCDQAEKISIKVLPEEEGGD